MEHDHWHVATGLAGYGPDGADGYAVALDSDMKALADVVADELRQAAEAERQSAEAFGDAEQYEDAWKTAKVSEQLAVMAENFNNERANAPLYAGRPELWDDTIRSMVTMFPVDISDSTRLYVWQCEHEKCEHLADYLAGHD